MFTYFNSPTIQVPSQNHGLMQTSVQSLKKGAKSLPSNYRPVSLTSVPCNLLEHIICKHIWLHCNHYSIITTKQHGFRSGMSCATHLVEALNDWTSVMNKGSGQVDVIVLDFSKAFDVVPLIRLLNKLRSYGITGPTLLWMEAFLTRRTQSVFVNGHSSAKDSVTS